VTGIVNVEHPLLSAEQVRGVLAAAKEDVLLCAGSRRSPTPGCGQPS
jgi:hypothetical protein